MGKIRDFFKKIRESKRTSHAKMSTIKERNGMDLTEAEDIKKRWQEYTEELYKKDLHDPDNHNGVQRNQRSNCHIHWITKKAREFHKNIYLYFIDYVKAFDCVDHNKLWKILKEWEYQTT